MGEQTLFEWGKEPPPDSGCCRCGKTVNADESPVLWRCEGCNGLVCRDHTLTIPGSHPAEYYEPTLCSNECWVKVGRPDE